MAAEGSTVAVGLYVTCFTPVCTPISGGVAWELDRYEQLELTIGKNQ